MRSNYAMMLIASLFGCSGTDAPTERFGPWAVTVDYAVIRADTQASVCLGDQCTPVRTADTTGRVTWRAVMYFDRSQLERGVLFVLTASVENLCPPQVLRFGAEDFRIGQKVVLCEGNGVQLRLHPRT